MKKLTRRQLAALVTAAGAAAQTPPPVDDLQAARERQKANSDLLAQQPLPMATEPAFQFKV